MWSRIDRGSGDLQRGSQKTTTKETNQIRTQNHENGIKIRYVRCLNRAEGQGQDYPLSGHFTMSKCLKSLFIGCGLMKPGVLYQQSGESERVDVRGGWVVLFAPAIFVSSVLWGMESDTDYGIDMTGNNYHKRNGCE